MAIKIWKFSKALGWHAIVASVLIALALFIDVGMKRPLEHELQTARSKHAASIRGQIGRVHGGAFDMARFRAHFKEPGDVTRSLALLYDVAEGKELKLGNAEYNIRQEKELDLEAYEIAFSVSGSYPQIREFAQLVLHRIPVAALDSIRMSRKKITDTQVDAELRFTFYHWPR